MKCSWHQLEFLLEFGTLLLSFNALSLGFVLRNDLGFCRCAPNVWSSLINTTTYFFDFETNETATTFDVSIWDFDLGNQRVSSQVLDGSSPIVVMDYAQVRNTEG